MTKISKQQVKALFITRAFPWSSLLLLHNNFDCGWKLSRLLVKELSFSLDRPAWCGSESYHYIKKTFHSHSLDSPPIHLSTYINREHPISCTYTFLLIFFLSHRRLAIVCRLFTAESRVTLSLLSFSVLGSHSIPRHEIICPKDPLPIEFT